MNESMHRTNNVLHAFSSDRAFKMLTIHYWHTGDQRPGARPDEISFPSLSLTVNSMKRHQELRRSSMPAFAEEEDLASFGPSPEGILPATKWRTPGPDNCVLDALNNACGFQVATKEDVPVA